jgi:hypothetical protein
MLFSVLREAHMTEPTATTPKANYVYAAIAAAVGLYFIAVGARLLPIPGGPSNLHSPLWVLLCAGAVFFFAGVALVIQSFGATATGELPADAPRWLRILQFAIAVAIFGCFGAIASWIAFGPGERHFSAAVMTGNATIDAAVGRMAFGVGAVIIWLCTAAVIASGIRKLFDQNTPRAS